MRLEVVRLADVKPDPNNPRKDFGNIEALAEKLRRNPIHPGEPINAIVTVRDGKGQRIVDGERRYKAMLFLGLEECHAIVCDDLDDANSVIAMLDTDDKLQLTDVERSRGVQQMLLLGVDDATAEEAGGLPAGSAQRIRRGRRRAGKKAEQMSVEHLLAVADAEERGDDEAAKAIAKASEDEGRSYSEWKRTADKYERLRDYERGWDALCAVCEEQGIPVADRKPKGAVLKETFYGLNIDDEKRIRRDVCSVNGKRLVLVGHAPTLENTYIHPELYAMAPELSEKERSDQTSKSRLKSAMTAAKKRRARFVGRLLVEDVARLKNTLELFCTDFATAPYEVSDFAEKAGIEASDIECWTSPYFMAAKWPHRDGMTQHDMLNIMCESRHGSRERAEAERFARLMDALVADGYEPDESEAALHERCRSIAERKG